MVMVRGGSAHAAMAAMIRPARQSFRCFNLNPYCIDVGGPPPRIGPFCARMCFFCEAEPFVFFGKSKPFWWVCGAGGDPPPVLVSFRNLAVSGSGVFAVVRNCAQLCIARRIVGALEKWRFEPVEAGFTQRRRDRKVKSRARRWLRGIEVGIPDSQGSTAKWEMRGAGGGSY